MACLVRGDTWCDLPSTDPVRVTSTLGTVDVSLSLSWNSFKPITCIRSNYDQSSAYSLNSSLPEQWYQKWSNAGQIQLIQFQSRTRGNEKKQKDGDQRIVDGDTCYAHILFLVALCWCSFFLFLSFSPAGQFCSLTTISDTDHWPNGQSVESKSLVKLFNKGKKLICIEEMGHGSRYYEQASHDRARSGHRHNHSSSYRWGFWYFRFWYFRILIHQNFYTLEFCTFMFGTNVDWFFSEQKTKVWGGKRFWPTVKQVPSTGRWKLPTQ